MDELEELRQRKLQDMMGAQQDEQAQLQQQIYQLESMVKSAMTREAIVRFGNIKAAHPEKAVQVLVVLAQLLQAGQLKAINDEKLKEILAKMQPEKKRFSIRRK